MKKIEQKLDEWLVKKAPYQLPPGWCQKLVKIVPALTLIIGCGMLLIAGDIYRVATILHPTQMPQMDSAYSGIVSTTLSTSGTVVAIWVGLALLIVQALLLIFAFPGLRAHKKSGWNMLFATVLVNIAYNITFNVLYYLQLNSLFASFVGTILALYLLFQIREYYIPSPATAKTPAAPVTSKD